MRNTAYQFRIYPDNGQKELLILGTVVPLNKKPPLLQVVGVCHHFLKDQRAR